MEPQSFLLYNLIDKLDYLTATRLCSTSKNFLSLCDSDPLIENRLNELKTDHFIATRDPRTVLTKAHILIESIRFGDANIFHQLIKRGYGRLYRDKGDLLQLAVLHRSSDIANYILVFFTNSISSDDLMNVLNNIHARNIDPELYNKIVALLKSRKGGLWRLDHALSNFNLNK